jgi:ABC-type lipoprotein release transport system permease subunit
MISKLITILVGASLGAVILGAVLGLTISLLVLGVLAIGLLIRRDWVPVIYNVRSLTVRGWTSAATALGLALVVFVFATVLMLASGIQKTLAATGSPDNAHIMRKGASSEIQSGIQPDQLHLLCAAPETATSSDGKPVCSAELAVLIYAQPIDAKSESEGSNVPVRGVSEMSMVLHPPHSVDGRMMRPGTSEIVIGRALVGRFKGARLGESMRFARRDWQVVGVMNQGGNGFDSEVWGDLDQFEDAFARRPASSAVSLRLRDQAALSSLEARLASDPMLNTLEVKREVDYWSAQSENFASFVEFLGIFVAVIFAVGAILGAMITMYAQVAARTREIGTLRALGFRRRSVLVSFVVESVLLALASGSVGVAMASLMQLVSFSTLNFQSFSEISFRFVLSPGIVTASFIFACVMGYAGGLLPALHASRMSIVEATRGG